MSGLAVLSLFKVQAASSLPASTEESLELSDLVDHNDSLI
jgi:hypothetical protein